MTRKIILIDGNSLVYRAFFALPTTLSLPSGQVTNAVYGFTSMLLRLLIDEKPDAVAVAFDSRGPTWRHDHYELYKAHREATPDELISQFPLVKEVLAALAIPIFEAPGHEADDILATLAARARTAGDEVLVVTGDRDAFQLIQDKRVRVMTTKRGITDIVIYDRAKVIERYGVAPEQVPDFLGLKGDPSDNIPGVPGVGDKTAAKLIQEFGSMEALFGRLDEVGSDKLRGVLGANREQAEMSKKLAVLNQNVPLDKDLDDVKFGQWAEPTVREVFSRLEFRTLLERFEAKIAKTGSSHALLEVRVNQLGADDLRDWLKARDILKPLGVDIIRDPDGPPAGLAMAFPKKNRSEAFTVNPADLSRDDLNRLRDRLNAPGRVKSIYDVKAAINAAATLGLSLDGDFFDPMLAAYLLAPSDLGQDFQQLARHYLDRGINTEGSPAETAASRAAAAVALMPPLKAALSKEKLEQVLFDIELPLSRVLARMEACGVGLDRKLLAHLSKKMEGELAKLARHIYKLAGEEFNINSPQQVGMVLFEKLGLTPGRKTKTKAAFATDAAVLAKLIGAHKIVPLILEYRERAKLKSTYIDALPKLVNPATGRLHTSFNQAVTATGRLSSSNPNLQNIPTRTELGRQIREAFVPPHKDDKLLAADYSQIELRLLADLSGDEALKQAFTDGVDIHTATSAEVFGVAPSKVTQQMRRHAKAINFGIIYGLSPFGLSEQLEISTEEAKTYIDKYLSRYPKVRGYLNRCIKEAYKRGYVATVTGRKRYMRELKSANFNERSFGERVAVNAPLQGSAADIIKIAMINIDRWLIEAGLQTRMVLQVHDELIFEVPPLEEAVVTPKIKELMENAYPLSVPLEVKISFGKNWGEAK
ncbi:MAG: DNA polymerase I [Actinomycetota bacterium]|nr:DNA polymerase I [Actinomycetota bacterium]